jgi:hypothetical protein
MQPELRDSFKYKLLAAASVVTAPGVFDHSARALFLKFPVLWPQEVTAADEIVMSWPCSPSARVEESVLGH